MSFAPARSLSAAMASGVASVFRALADKLEVRESDFLLLELEKVTTADQLYFMLPSEANLEKFLEECIFPRGGEIDEGADPPVLGSVPREGAEDTAVCSRWLRSPDAAALRRLWEASRVTAKATLEKLADDRSDAPTKVTAPVLQDLVERAKARGLPSLAESELPGPISMGKVLDNFRAGGPFRYLAWEDYTSAEEEAKADRLGLTRKEANRISVTDGSLSVRAGATVFTRAGVSDIVALQDSLGIRAAALDIADVASYHLYMNLTAEYIRLLKRDAPDRMRGPTLHEVRLVDRLIHEEILGHVARQSGTLNNGVDWYLGPGRSHQIWSFLDPVAADVPDRGIEKAPQKRKVGPAFLNQEIPPTSVGAYSSGGDTSKCYVCGKTRREHAKGRFCASSKAPGAPPAQGAGQGKGGGRPPNPPGTGKRSRQRDGGLAAPPAFMVGCAARTPPSPGNPSGIKFCFLHHNPESKGCPKAAGTCDKSHKCPRFKDGRVCMGDHKLGACS